MASPVVAGAVTLLYRYVAIIDEYNDCLVDKCSNVFLYFLQ